MESELPCGCVADGLKDDDGSERAGTEVVEWMRSDSRRTTRGQAKDILQLFDPGDWVTWFIKNESSKLIFSIQLKYCCSPF